jgi:hypothetical protein
MFKENKYTRIYYQIIEQARVRKLTGYTENHHIIPKSLSGPDEPFNIVALTAREHFICHWLLTKMVTGKRNEWKMINALGHMMWSENKNQERFKVNARTYELLKKKHSEWKSWALAGERNGMHGRKLSDEQKKAISERNTGWQPTDEMRKKISDSKKGKSRSIETKRKISETKKLKKLSAGENNPMHGRKHSPETIEKIRQAALKRKNKLNEKTS